MVVGGYRSGNVMHPRGGYRKSYDIIALILHHKNYHYLRPNMVILKYLDLKKDVDLDHCVKVFKEVAMLCEENMIIAEIRSALLVL
jgi:hypothetical protein